MKNVREETLSVTAANQALDVELASAMWAFIIKALNYPELEFNQKTDSILYMGYVPFLELAKEYLAGIEDGTFDVRSCECCAGYFDINKTAIVSLSRDRFCTSLCKTASFTRQLIPFAPTVLRTSRFRIAHCSKLLVHYYIMTTAMTLRQL